MSRRKSASKLLPTVPASIDSFIHTVRGERVILDADLAKLYGVETKAFNQAVRRNRDKFPPDFMFELSRSEYQKLQGIGHLAVTNLRSQIVTSSRLHGGRRTLPYAFTEHGAMMAANILNSPEATQMSVFVIRAFIKMRGLLTNTRELAKKLAAMEKELTARLDSHETTISEFMRRIMLLLDPPPSPESPAKELGFHTGLKRPTK